MRKVDWKRGRKSNPQDPEIRNRVHTTTMMRRLPRGWSRPSGSRSLLAWTRMRPTSSFFSICYLVLVVVSKFCASHGDRPNFRRMMVRKDRRKKKKHIHCKEKEKGYRWIVALSSANLPPSSHDTQPCMFFFLRKCCIPLHGLSAQRRIR